MISQDARVSTDRPTLLTRPMILLLVVSIGTLTSTYLLLSVVPLYVGTSGTSSAGTGMSTGAMMLSTVLMELAVPALLARLGYRNVMALGAFLLGAPALALLVSPALPLVLGVCLARGAGLGIVVVTGTALVAELVPAERRGEGLGLYGVAVGVPAIAGLPLGVWLSQHVGYRPVFLAAAVLALGVLAAASGLPSKPGLVEQRTGVLGGLRDGGLARPTAIFATNTLALGVIVTFVPLALEADSPNVATAALLAQSLATPFTRWGAGRYGDRHGPGRLLIPSVLTAALGTAGLILVDSPLAVIAGCALFGAGFGAAQNVTLALMFERAKKSEFGKVSALWNLAFDGGMGIGAVGFGLVIGPLGYATGFALTAAIIFAALLPSWRDRTTITPAS